MNNLIKNYYSLDNFLKWQLAIGLIANITWSLCIPIIHKLQGLYWSTTYISLYFAFNNMSGLFVPFFRGGSLKTYYVLRYILNILYGFSLLLYFFNIQIFLFTEVILAMIFGIVGPLWRISYDLYVVQKYNKNVYEDFLYLDNFRVSLGGVLGGFLVAVTSMFFNIDQSILLFFVFISFVMYAETLNWKKFYKSM